MPGNEENPNYGIYICSFLLFLPHIALLFVLLLIFLKRNTKTLLLLVGLLILLVFLFPAYWKSPFAEVFSVCGQFLQEIQDGKNPVMAYISTPFHYHFLTHFFFIHISVIACLTCKEIQERTQTIESLDHALTTIKRKGEKNLKRQVTAEQNRIGETVIGTKGGKTAVATDDNMRHLFLCGTTGAGKTVALANYIENAIKKGYPALIVDGKGDIDKGSLLEIVRYFQGARKVYIIDMNNPESSAPYNPFSNTSPSVVKDMLVNMTDWSEEHYKTNTERYLQKVVSFMQKLKIPISFKSLIASISPDNASDLLTKCYKEKKITKEEYIQTLEIFKESASIALDASARFATIAESDIGSIFSENGVDIFQALQEQSVILFILNPLLYPEITRIFGRLILIDAKKAVSKLFTQRQERVFFIFDEINTYISKVLIDLINKSRSANVTCILATQSLSDLDEAGGETLREQVIENCNNYLLMRQNSAKNAEAWAQILGTTESLAVTYQIGNKEKGSLAATGLGTVKKDRSFLYHPDDIKQLKTGEAIYMSKDTGKHCKIIVRKGF